MPVNIHGKEYHTVAERIQLLNLALDKSGTDYSLTTELISWDNDIVIMKAVLTLVKGESVMTYSGHAYEKEDSSQINKTSALENCETSAIGRALSAAGFGGGNEYASANEVENAIHQQKPRPLTKGQIKIIEELKGHNRIDVDTYNGVSDMLSATKDYTYENGEAAINKLHRIIDDGLEN